MENPTPFVKGRRPQFVKRNEQINHIEEEKRSKNKWKWEWLDNLDSNQYPMHKYLRKTYEAGAAYCLICEQTINYKNAGKSALMAHSKKDKHVSNYRRLISQPKLLNSTDDYGELETAAQIPIILQERVSCLEAQVLAFASSHALSHETTADLVELLKEATKDPDAVHGLQLSSTSIKRKLVHGMASGFTDTLIDTLKKTPFSLNIDEALTKNGGLKLLSFLVCFYDFNKEKTVIHNLKTVTVLNTKAETMFTATQEIFEENEIPWDNLISVFTDNTNCMIGEHAGLQAKIRDIHPNLIDVGGDSVHIINNAVEKITTAFDNHIVELFKSINADFRLSVEHKFLFQQICYHLGLPMTNIGRFLEQRWMSVFDQAESVLLLWDAMYIYYHSYLTEDEKKKPYSMKRPSAKCKVKNQEMLSRI